MHSICSDFLKYLKEKGLKAATIEIYENAVKQFTQWLIENGILSFFAADRETLEQFFNHVHKRDIKPHTRYRICSSVKALYAWLQQENRILTNPTPRIRTLREKRLPHAIPTQKELKTVYRTLQKSAQTNHATTAGNVTLLLSIWRTPAPFAAVKSTVSMSAISPLMSIP